MVYRITKSVELSITEIIINGFITQHNQQDYLSVKTLKHNAMNL